MRTARRLGTSALLLAAVGVALTGTGATQASASVEPGVWWNGAYEGYCLDGGTDGQAFLGHCDPDALHQRWNSPAVSGEPGSVGEVFKLVNQDTGQCLAAGADGHVVTAACSDAADQSWVGGSLLVNQATGECAAAESPSVIDLVACDPEYLHDNQRWYPAEVGP